MNIFEECISVVFAHEGGYAFNENDPGGETKYGISKRSYPELNIRELTREQAKGIYERDFWKPLKLYMIDNANICLELFDFSVNAGISRAVKMAQKLAGTQEDGIMGGMTAKAINEFEGDYVKAYKHARRIYYEHLGSKDRYGIFLKGWLSRIDNNYFLNI